MDVLIDRKPGRCRVTVQGELDLATSSQLREALAHELRSGSVTFDLDLSAVTFMDSSGLHVITWARSRAEGYGGRLTVSHSSRSVTRLLRITHTEALLA